MKEKVIPLCKVIFRYPDDWSIVDEPSSDAMLLLSKKYPHNKVRYISIYRDLYTEEDYDLEMLFDDSLEEIRSQGYQIKEKNEITFNPDFDLEGEMTEYAFTALLSKDDELFFYAMSHSLFTLERVSEDDKDYMEAISYMHLHSERLYSYDYQKYVKDLKLYKGALYLGKGSNPYYYLYHVDGDNFDGHILEINPKCKVICSKVADSSSIIKTIKFPKGLKEIEDSAFRGCTDLMDVIIPEGLKVIGEDAFYGCYEIVSIELPTSLKELADGSFASLPIVASFIYKGTIEEWTAIKKGKDWIGGDYNFDVECLNGNVHYSNKRRYLRHDEKDEMVTKELIDEQIKEIIAFSDIEKAKVLRDLASGINEKLFYKRFKEEKSKDFFLGLARLFIEAHEGRFTKEQYRLFLAMLNYQEKDLPIEEFENCTLGPDNDFLAYDTFDIITCGLSRIKRLKAVLIGCAIFSKDKLTKAELKLIDNLMGPRQ